MIDSFMLGGLSQVIGNFTAAILIIGVISKYLSSYNTTLRVIKIDRTLEVIKRRKNIKVASSLRSESKNSKNNLFTNFINIKILNLQDLSVPTA
mgnify:CR=1 FL=1